MTSLFSFSRFVYLHPKFVMKMIALVFLFLAPCFARLPAAEIGINNVTRSIPGVTAPTTTTNLYFLHVNDCRWFWDDWVQDLGACTYLDYCSGSSAIRAYSNGDTECSLHYDGNQAFSYMMAAAQNFASIDFVAPNSLGTCTSIFAAAGPVTLNGVTCGQNHLCVICDNTNWAIERVNMRF